MKPDSGEVFVAPGVEWNPLTIPSAICPAVGIGSTEAAGVQVAHGSLLQAPLTPVQASWTILRGGWFRCLEEGRVAFRARLPGRMH